MHSRNPVQDYKNFVETGNDNGVLSDVVWVPETENSDDEVFDWLDSYEKPNHLFDYCFDINLISSNDDYSDYHG